MREAKIMLDLETMGVGNNAAIVAIGACRFSQVDGIQDLFYRVIDPSSAAQFGNIDGGTFAWWCTQSVDARKIFADKSVWVQLPKALEEFSTHCLSMVDDIRDIEMFGNGSDFDNVVLGNAYEKTGLKRPWLYSGNRCFRTIKAMVTKQQGKILWDRHSPGLLHHNALDDAIRQARIALDIMKLTDAVKAQQI